MTTKLLTRHPSRQKTPSKFRDSGVSFCPLPPFLRRVISCFILVSMGLQLDARPSYALPSVEFASGTNASYESSHAFLPASVNVPQEYGDIIERFQGSARDALILIQDAHALPEAQRNVEKIIGYFEDHYGVRLVAAEGAASRLDPRLFRSFPDQKQLRKVLEEYYGRGELTGVAGAAIFSRHEGEYHGVEDWNLYERGLELYLAALARQQDILKNLSHDERKLRMEKRKMYSENLLAVDRALARFEADTSSWAEVLTLLSGIKRPKEGTDLAVLLAGIEASQRDSGEEIDGEIRRIVERIEKHFKTIGLVNGEWRVFNQKKQAYRIAAVGSGDYALFLEEFLRKSERRLKKTGALPLAVKFSQPLRQLIKNERRMRALQGEKIYKMFEDYGESVKALLFRNDRERELNRRGREIFLRKKFAKLELSRLEWQEVKGMRLSDEKTHDADFSFHTAFYKNAERREGAFWGNLRKVLSQRHSRGEKPLEGSVKKPAVMVAGGFHTSQLVKHLKSEGISYVLVRPKIGQMEPSTNYRAQMRGDVSWKDYFEVEKGRVHLYKAFVRAVRDRLLGVRGEKAEIRSKKDEVRDGSDGVRDRKHEPEGLKRDSYSGSSYLWPRSSPFFHLAHVDLVKPWRDQLLRDLAGRGEIGKASEYTPYLDEISASGHGWNAIERKWIKNFKHFIQKLSRLENPRALTEENFLSLLKASTVLQAAGGNSSLDVQGRLKSSLMDDLPRSVRGRVFFTRTVSEEALARRRSEVRSISSFGFLHYFRAKSIVQSFPKVFLRHDFLRSPYKPQPWETLPQFIDRSEDVQHDERIKKVELAIALLKRLAVQGADTEMEKRADELIKRNTSIIGIDIPTHLLFYDPRGKRAHIYHIDRRKNAIYLPLRFLDSINMNLSGIEELALYLDRAQRWLDAYHQLIQTTKDANAISQGMRRVEMKIKKESSHFFLSATPERIAERIAFLRAQDEEIQKNEILPKIEKLKQEIHEQEDALMKIRASKNLPPREGYKSLAHLYGQLAHLQENIGSDDEAIQAYRDQVDAVHDLQRTDSQGELPYRMQEDIVRIFLLAGLHDEFLRELEVLLTGEGFPKAFVPDSPDDREVQKQLVLNLLTMGEKRLWADLLYILKEQEEALPKRERSKIRQVRKRVKDLFENMAPVLEEHRHRSEVRKDGRAAWEHALLWTAMGGVIAGVFMGYGLAAVLGFMPFLLFYSVQRARVEARLHESQRKYKEFFESIPIPFHRLDKAGLIVDVNQKWLATLGYERGEVIGRSIIDFIVPEQREEAKARLYERLSMGEAVTKKAGDRQYFKKDGTRIIVLSADAVQRDGKGHPAGILRFFQDITALRLAEKAVRESEQIHRTLLENLTDYRIFVKDIDSRFVMGNDNFASGVGKSAKELIGLSDYDLYPAELAEAYRAADQEVLKSGQPIAREEINIVNDEERYVWTVKSPILDDQKRATGLVGIFTDITERKKAEQKLTESHTQLQIKNEQLRRALAELEARQKQLVQYAELETAGILAGGIVHDIRNLLAPVLGYSELLKESLSNDLADYAETIREAALSMTEMLQGYLKFSKPGSDRAVQVNIRKVIADTLAVEKRNLEKFKIEVHVQAGNDISMVLGVENQLKRVFLNLVINAIDAMPQGGKLNVEILHTNENMVRILFTDTGTGIEKERWEKIFEPFNSTKGDKGTGLGLSVARMIIKAHGLPGRPGVMRVAASGAGQGTTFEILVPVAKPVMETRAELRNRDPAESPLSLGKFDQVILKHGLYELQSKPEELQGRHRILHILKDALDRARISLPDRTAAIEDIIALAEEAEWAEFAGIVSRVDFSREDANIGDFLLSRLVTDPATQKTTLFLAKEMLYGYLPHDHPYRKATLAAEFVFFEIARWKGLSFTNKEKEKIFPDHNTAPAVLQKKGSLQGEINQFIRNRRIHELHDLNSFVSELLDLLRRRRALLLQRKQLEEGGEKLAALLAVEIDALMDEVDGQLSRLSLTAPVFNNRYLKNQISPFLKKTKGGTSSTAHDVYQALSEAGVFRGLLRDTVEALRLSIATDVNMEKIKALFEDMGLYLTLQLSVLPAQLQTDEMVRAALGYWLSQEVWALRTEWADLVEGRITAAEEDFDKSLRKFEELLIALKEKNQFAEEDHERLLETYGNAERGIASLKDVWDLLRWTEALPPLFRDYAPKVANKIREMETLYKDGREAMLKLLKHDLPVRSELRRGGVPKKAETLVRRHSPELAASLQAVAQALHPERPVVLSGRQARISQELIENHGRHVFAKVLYRTIQDEIRLQRDSLIPDEIIEIETRTLLETLSLRTDNSQATYAVGLALPGRSGQAGPLGLNSFIRTISKIPQIRTLAVNGKIGEAEWELLKRSGKNIRPLNNLHRPVFFQQKVVPLAVFERGRQIFLTEAFISFQLDESLVQDPFVRDFAQALQAVLLLHAAKILEIHPELLKDTASLRAELLNKLPFLEGFEAVIQADSRSGAGRPGFVISALAAQAYLQYKAQIALRQSA